MTIRHTKAVVYMHDRLAGYLERAGSGSQFQYAEEYLNMAGQPLSWSMPLRSEPYVSETGLPAYFSGLCSEGWSRKVQTSSQGIHPGDDFTLLVNNGLDCAGAVTIEPVD
ncbi:MULTISPECIES: HipA N-terminal domain-containing protein [Marinobacter]|uniref:HipA N-terminal domain-containing protein n=1 Tax=Marinobacter TaxID=2742 RepID=UPI001246D4C2|nr:MULTISPECIES: HipA N-terminal domain-containing protein [Marinobacter]MBL3557603.1 HipA N-terminal domain-containing protein [Marinobacter sp. JB05H06]